MPASASYETNRGAAAPYEPIYENGIYGDGSDGNVTIAAGTTTLTRDQYYDQLTVNGTLDCAGYRVFCKTSCLVNSGGAITHNGNAASGATGGTGLGFSGTSLGGNGQAGANGGTGNGSNTSNLSTNAKGGRGGAGGNGTPNFGGTAGTVTTPAGMNSGRNAIQGITGAAMGLVGGTYSVAEFWGGTGGGGGGGDGTNSGGGGGSPAQMLVLAAKSINNAGTISANGGAGAAGVAGNSGGGGGGGGGVVFVTSHTYSGTVPTAAGGAGGAGVGTGTAGAAGSAGLVVQHTV